MRWPEIVGLVVLALCALPTLAVVVALVHELVLVPLLVRWQQRRGVRQLTREVRTYIREREARGPTPRNPIH